MPTALPLRLSLLAACIFAIALLAPLASPALRRRAQNDGFGMRRRLLLRRACPARRSKRRALENEEGFLATLEMTASGMRRRPA